MKRALRSLVTLLAAAFVVEVSIGVVGIPGWVGYWMSGSGSGEPVDPRYVIVLGGGGIPSESGLMRTYYAAEMRKTFTGLVYVVSLPCEGDPATNSVGRMRDELTMRGVPASSILMEYEARDTHEQAVNMARLLGPSALRTPVCIVTDFWHLRRAIGCFRKAGFQRITGTAAVNLGAEADPGKGILWRYAFWANLKSLVDCAREGAALLVYRWRGWI